MKIVVVSDSHGMTSFLDKIPMIHPDARMYLHAGDSEMHDFELGQFETVKGNCDYYIENKYKFIDLYGVKIFMFHGDHTSLDLNVLVGIAKNKGANIIIHGHTHIPYYNYVDGVHVLCPGSLAYPRVTRATYAVITFTNPSDIKVEIKNYE